MRTTLNIDEDILMAAKEIAKQKRISIGRALSDLARQALTRESTTGTRNGLPIFPRQEQAGVVTLELVNQLRDENP
jgi:hypothetical protein